MDTANITGVTAVEGRGAEGRTLPQQTVAHSSSSSSVVSRTRTSSRLGHTLTVTSRVLGRLLSANRIGAYTVQGGPQPPTLANVQPMQPVRRYEDVGRGGAGYCSSTERGVWSQRYIPMCFPPQAVGISSGTAPCASHRKQ